MRIICLIAAYREERKQLERCIDACIEVGPVVLLGDPTMRGVFFPHVAAASIGIYLHERDKRNALLELARLELAPEPGDWFLTVDPDEGILAPDYFPELVARAGESLPAAPLLRQERNGDIWVMPCKFFRAAVDRYVYLDVAVRWRGSDWLLDPWQAGRGTVLPGWPALIHYRSPRADSPDGFYTDYTKLEEPAVYRDFILDRPEGALYV